MEFAQCPRRRRFSLRSLADRDGRESSPHPRRYRCALDVSLQRHFSGDLRHARGHTHADRLLALLSSADRIRHVRQGRSLAGARRFAADRMARVDPAIAVEAREFEPMMKAARRKNLTTSSLTFLRQKASAIKAALYDRSDRSRAQRSAGTAFLIRAASGALGLPFQVLLARWMGAHEFGIYAYVWTWVLLIGSFIDFGFETSAQRFIPAYSGTKKLELLRGFIRGSRWLVLGFAAVIAALAAIAIRTLQPWIHVGALVALPLARPV